MKVWVHILALVLGSVCRAEPPPPEYLYHWARFDTLSRVARQNRGVPGYPLDRIVEGYLTSTYRELEGRRGTYAWSHPVTGMAADESEVYGGEVVVKMRVSPNARVAQLTTRAGQRPERLSFDPNQIQLVYHTRYDAAGHLEYSEWLILDPAAVESYSGLPEASAPELRREVENLRNPQHRYAPDVVHFQDPDVEGRSRTIFNRPSWRERAANYVERFLRADKRKIPAVFRQKLGVPPTPCGPEYLELGGGR